MRILITALAATVFLLACQVNRTSKKEVRKPFKIEAYLLNQIATTDSNWNKNDIYEKRSSERFSDTLPSLLRAGILNDFPLEFSSVNEYRPGKFAARFDGAYSKKGFEFENPVYGLQFDVIALVDEATALNLKKDSFYTVEGKFKTFLGDEFDVYIGGMMNTWQVGYSRDNIMDNTPQVSMGIILMDSVKVTPAQKPDGGHRYN